jgi:hypothetical protein
MSQDKKEQPQQGDQGANRASRASNPARIPGSRHSSPAKSPARKADFDENPASLAGFSLLTAVP